MPIKANMFAIILISAQVLAQSNVQLSEIETNPIPTIVNFDGYQRNELQSQQEQGYFDPTFVSSNTDLPQNIENHQSFEDPNNFILDHLDVSTLNPEITSIQTNENQIQVRNFCNKEVVNDIPQLDMIDTQIRFKQHMYWFDLTLAETQKITVNPNCIVIYSQCHFKGESLQLCESQKNINNFDHDIKSIQIPEGYSVRLYNKEDFSGEKIILKESQECLNKPLVLIQLYEKKVKNTMVMTQNQNLRAF